MPTTQEVRFFTASGTPILASQRLLLPASWSITGRGGMESFELPTAATWSQLTGLVPGVRADLYISGLLRFRGWIAERSRTRGAGGQPDTLQLSGFGLWRRISKLPCDRQYLYPGGVDLSRALADLAADFVLPAFPDLVRDFPQIGYKVTSLDATLSTVGDVLSELSRWLSGRMVFGTDVDSDGNDRLFVRPIDTTPSLYVPLPGRGTLIATQYGASQLTEEQATRLRIVGGQPRFPNLVKNSGFETVRFATEGEDAESLLTDPGFEDRSSAWTLSGGASYKVGGLGEGPTYAGNDMVETDTSGESFEQEDTSDARIVPGNTIVFGAYVRREVGGTASTGRIRLYWKDSGGSETLGYEEIAVAPASVAWELYNDSVLVPTGAAGWRLKAEQLSGSLLWDECILSDGSLSRPVGWTSETFGSATIRTTVVGTSPYEGGRVLRVVATASDTDGQDCRVVTEEFGILARQKLRAKVRLRNPIGGTSPKMRLDFHVENKDGAKADYSQTIAAGAVGSSWTTISFEQQIPLSGASKPYDRCSLRLVWRGNGTIDVDAVEVRDAAAPSADPYLRDGSLVIELGCADVFDSGTETALHDAETSQGTWWATEQVESVLDWDGAVQFARGYLSTRALPQERPPLVLTGLDATLLRPGQLIAFRGEDGAALSTDPLPVLRLREELASGLLTTTIESGRETPTVEGIVRELAQKSKRARVVASGGGASSYGGAGAGTPSFSTPAISLPLAIAEGGTGSTSASAARTALGVDTESIQDLVAAFLVAGSNITLTYSDAGNTLTVAAAGGGMTPQTTDFTSAGTTAYTIPAGATYLDIFAIGAGGGGGSGMKNTNGTNRGGGAGGCGGGYSWCRLQVSELGSITSFSVAVGAGGTGGASQTTTGSAGNDGSAGGDTTVTINTVVRLIARGGAGGGGGTSVSGLAGAPSELDSWPGGAGGAGGLSSTGSVGNDAAHGAGGGGGGGGSPAANSTHGGGAGGLGSQATNPGATRAATGAGGSAGGNGATPGLGFAGNGGAGSQSILGSPPGAGGNGTRGGGGGGGAASNSNSGAGGNGGDGFVRIVAW